MLTGCPGPSSETPPHRTCLEHLPKEASRGHPEQVLGSSQMTPFEATQQHIYSEILPNDWASHRVSEGSPSHPTEETYFGHLYPRSCPFTHYAKFMTIASVGWPVNQECRLSTLQLFYHHSLAHNCGGCANRLSISGSIFPFRYLNYSTWSKVSPPTWRVQATLFWSETMASKSGLLRWFSSQHITQGCQPPKCRLKVPAWWRQQDNIICKKQRWNHVVPKNTCSLYL